MTREQLAVKMIEIYEDHPGTAIERMLKALRLAESEIPPPPSQAATIKALVEALEAYEQAIDEAEAIFGGEYADSYGPMFALAMKARDARRSALVRKGV